MDSIDELRAALPEAAKDIKVNLQVVLQQGTLSNEQRWGVALACALATRNESVRKAVYAEARGQVASAVLDDAVAAAALMGMNNVYYRFRHMIGKDSYAKMPARLRMNRIVKPATSKADFELFCLAVSAINGCEACLRAHENTVRNAGLTEEQVHDAVRIAANLQAAAVSLEAAAIGADIAGSMSAG